MKRIIALICLISIILVPLYVSAGFVFSGELNTLATLVVECEDITDYDSSAVSVKDMEGASGGKVLSIAANAHNMEVDGVINVPKYDIRYVADITEHGAYNVWVRIRTNNSLYFAVDDGKYSAYGAGATADTVDSADPNYTWRTLGTFYKAPGDTLEIRGAHRYRNNSLDKIIITTDNTFQPSGKYASGVSGANALPTGDTTLFYPIASFKPTKGHPRVYITADRVDELRENAKQPEMEPFIKNMSNQARWSVDSVQDNSYNPTVPARLRGRAMWYLLGYASDEHGRKTIEYCKEYLATAVYPKVGDITRQIGDQMEATAIVYDWLYDLLTEDDKKFIIAKLKHLAKQKEIGYPPMGNVVYGHNGEKEIFQDMLSAGIAIYDEDTEIFNLAAGMFEEMVPSRQLFNATGNHPSGDAYGTWRLRCELMSELLLEPLGVPLENRIGKNVWNVPLRWIYSRKPTGGVFREGDTATPKYFEYQLNRTPEMMAIIANMYPDSPYNSLIYGEWLMNESLVNWASMPFYMLLVWDKDNPNTADFGDDMPLTYYSTYPLTQMYARTGWQKGIDAPTAMAYMQGRETLTDIHDHPDLGSFQIFYKGTLANDSIGGEGGGWITEMDANWARRSISHNLVTVKDPEEVFFDNYYIYERDWKVVSNDGGQDWHNLLDARFQSTYEDLINRKQLAKTEGIYVGPNNSTPEFSYLQTDITNAYSGRRVNAETGALLQDDLNFDNVSGTVVARDKIFESLGMTNHYEDFFAEFDAKYPVVKKISDNTRSMVFIDLFNDEYPAAFVCFDKVDSTNAEFEKNWLLHTLEEPEITGNTTVVKRTNYGFNGKMIVKTLLPENPHIEVIGGEGKGTWVDGKNYGDIPDDEKEGGGWRVEISPSVAAKNDLFLNAMYVTDYDRNLPELPMYKEESGNYVGVTVMDRVVMFAKDAEDTESAFTLNIRNNNNGGNMSVMVADVAPGVWSVAGPDKTQYIEVTEEQCALYFKGKPGEYTITGANGKTADNITYKKTEKPAIGDYQIYGSDGLFRYQKSPTKLIDGVPYFAAVDYLPYYGAQVIENSDNSITIKWGTVNSVTLWPDTTDALINGKRKTIEHTPELIEGKLYINPMDIEDTINCSITYDKTAYVMKVNVLEPDEEPDDYAIKLVPDGENKLPAGTRIYADVKALDKGQKVMFITDGVKSEASVGDNGEYYTVLTSDWHEICAAICDETDSTVIDSDTDIYCGVDFIGDGIARTGMDFSNPLTSEWTVEDYVKKGMTKDTKASFDTGKIVNATENGNNYIQLVGWGHPFTDPLATFENGNLVTGTSGGHYPSFIGSSHVSKGVVEISFDWMAEKVEVINSDGTVAETRYFSDKTTSYAQKLTAIRYLSTSSDYDNCSAPSSVMAVSAFYDATNYASMTLFKLSHDGTISAEYYEGDEKKSLALNVDPGQWNNYRAVLDTTASKVWLYANDVLVAEGDMRVLNNDEIPMPVVSVRSPQATGIRIYGNESGIKCTVRSYVDVDNFVYRHYEDGFDNKTDSVTANPSGRGVGIVFENFSPEERLENLGIISQGVDKTYEVQRFDATATEKYQYFTFGNIANKIFIWNMEKLKPLREAIIPDNNIAQ